MPGNFLVLITSSVNAIRRPGHIYAYFAVGDGQVELLYQLLHQLRVGQCLGAVSLQRLLKVQIDSVEVVLHGLLDSILDPFVGVLFVGQLGLVNVGQSDGLDVVAVGVADQVGVEGVDEGHRGQLGPVEIKPNVRLARKHKRENVITKSYISV